MEARQWRRGKSPRIHAWCSVAVISVAASVIMACGYYLDNARNGFHDFLTPLDFALAICAAAAALWFSLRIWRSDLRSTSIVVLIMGLAIAAYIPILGPFLRLLIALIWGHAGSAGS